MRATLIVASFVALSLSPIAQAWSATPSLSLAAPEGAAQAPLPFQPRLAALGLPGADAAAPVNAALACALGDLNVDGHADLLVRAAAANGEVSLKALAGPAFTDVLWKKVTSAQAVLHCAADLDADAVADPVLRLAGQAVSQVPNAAGAVADGTTHVALQTLSGVSGAVQVSRVVTESATGVAQAGVSVGSQAAAQLLPAAQGAVALLQTKSQAAVGAVLGAIPALPVAGIAASPAASASLQVLDVAGNIVGTVEVNTPGVTPLALATIPAGALPAVVSLTTTATSSLGDMAAQVPRLSLFNADGSLAWAIDLAATTGSSVLVPRIGDLDLDGVVDLAVETVTSAQDPVTMAKVTLVSGADGAILATTQVTGGLSAVLPLGQVKGAAELLLATAAKGADASIALSALDGAGRVLWTAALPALSFPANLALDAHTGDAIGFTDLTGDGIPDIGAATVQGNALAVSVLDGLTGKVAWAAKVADATDVLAIPRTAIGAVGGVAKSAQGLAGPVLASAAGQASDLLAIGGSGHVSLSLLRGLDGQVVWTVTNKAASSLTAIVQSAGDLDADGVADLLLTTASDAAEAAGSAGVAAGAQVHAISALTGLTLAANASVDGKLPDPLSLVKGPAYPVLGAQAASGSKVSPGAGLGGLAVVGLAALLRRRTEA
ncbi:MAG TPA: hypothetical protein VM286_04130 [Candidatus Thermoplasmatota archaeon]|nr:hypothetical protein [Candidatus Thermoplasmatota archaeon]